MKTKMRFSLNMSPWANDFKGGVVWYERICLYICDFPIVAWREYRWGTHGDCEESVSHAFAILCFQINTWQE